MNDSISIIGGTITGNKGAEAMLASAIGNLEKKGFIKFNVFSYYPKEDKKLNKKNNVFIYSSTPLYLVFILFPLSVLLSFFQKINFKFFNNFFPESILALSKSKYLYCIAGVSFIDGREKFIPFNIFTLLPAIIMRVKVIKLAQAMGPFNNYLNRFFAKLILSKCFHIYCRGRSTFKNVASLLNNKTNYSLSSDLVFLYGPSYSLRNYKHIEFSKILLKNNKKIIGISPSSVLAGKSNDYLNFLVDMIKELSLRNFHIVLYPNAVRELNQSHKSHNNDLLIINNLKKKLCKIKNISYIDFDIHINELLRLYKKLYVNITSRFHVMIPSLKLHIPTIVIGWSHKYKEILSEFELDDFMIDYNEISIKKFMKLFSTLEKNHVLLRKLMKKKIPLQKKLASNQFDFL